jgi:uncharacterized protein (DUF4213/DUF364 family)
MSSKIHPHLKSFIKSVVLAEMSTIGPSKTYLWKETLMKEVVSSILEKLDNCESEEKLKEELSLQIKAKKIEINEAFDMIESTLGHVPLNVFKRVK